MREFMGQLTNAWLYMLEPPWQHSGADDEWADHYITWVHGWGWALAGLVGGAVYAPALVQAAHLANYPYQDWLILAVVVLAGFLVQFVGWALFALAAAVAKSFRRLPTVAIWLMALLVFWLPFVGVGYGIYRYLTWVGTGQRAVTVAFVGGLLIKTFVIPAIWGAFKSRAFRWFMNWLRGGKDTKKTD